VYAVYECNKRVLAGLIGMLGAEMVTTMVILVLSIPKGERRPLIDTVTLKLDNFSRRKTTHRRDGLLPIKDALLFLHHLAPSSHVRIDPVRDDYVQSVADVPG